MVMSSFEYDEEFEFGDVCDRGFDENLNFSTVWSFQYVVTLNIEKLDKMWKIYREIEGDNIVLLVIFLE